MSEREENVVSKRAPEAVGAFPHAKRVGDLLFLSGIGPRVRGSKEIPGVTLDADGEIADYEILPDEPARVSAHLREIAGRRDVQTVILNGGTGIALRDTTYEAVVSVLDKRIDGFGELLRMLSYDDIGSAAMLSRAVAGTLGTTSVFALPGSTAACELAMDRLVLPELGHIARLLGHGA